MLRLHERAQAEIREAAGWYEAASVGLGKRFVAAVREAFENLETNPAQFGKLETLTSNAPFRRALVRGFPYLVVFEVFEEDVFVYAVAHSARRPNYWRKRKSDRPRE